MRRGRPSLGATTQILREAPIRKGWTNVKDFLVPSLGLGTCSFLRRGIAQQHLRPWVYLRGISLELTTAVLLAQARTRLWGSALGCTVMLAAFATVTLHGEYGHGVPPLIAATLSIVVGWTARRKRLPSSA
jgi:hypothetical protein